MFRLLEKQKKKLLKQGFHFADNQHNGSLFARLDRDRILHRRVVDHTGNIIAYKPRKATRHDLKLYRR